MPRDTIESIRRRAGIPGGYREVSALAFPVALSMLSQILMWLVDTSLLGHISPAAQGAAGFAGHVVWLLLSLFYSMSTGVNILVAQSHGAQRHAHCGLIAWQGLYVSVLAWLALVLCGLSARHLLQHTHPSPALLEPAVVYMQIRLLGALPMLINFTLLGFFRGLGDTLTPLWITALTNTLNVLLDYLLIFGHGGLPRLEIAGAALAAVLATTGGSVLYLGVFLHRGRRQGFLTRWRAPWDRHVCWHLLRMTLPIGAQGILETSAWTFLTILVAQLGTSEAAAQQIALSVHSCSSMFALGFTIAATTLVGRYLGAGQRLAAVHSARACCLLVTLVLGILGVGLFVARSALVRLFTQDQTVAALGMHVLMYVALFQLCQGLGLVAAGVLRGAGDTRWPMGAGVIASWGILLPIAWFAMFSWHAGVSGAWLGAVCSGVIFALLMLMRILQGQWQSV